MTPFCLVVFVGKSLGVTPSVPVGGFGYTRVDDKQHHGLLAAVPYSETAQQCIHLDSGDSAEELTQDYTNTEVHLISGPHLKAI